jgi:peroxiredoxin family protein
MSGLLMSKITDLQDVKNKKKYKQIVEDINAILRVLDLTQRSLIHYKKYRNVQEIISSCETNMTLLDIHKKKYEKELELDETKK